MEFFDRHVLTNLARYQQAETNLSRVARDFPEGSEEFTNAAGEAMVDAMNACSPAYHMADHVLEQYHRARPAVVYGATDLRDYRDYLDQNRCIYIGNGKIIDDLSLLGAVVDAYKHFDLRNKSRPVTSASATVVVATGWGKLPSGEGKYGGAPQVIVQKIGGNLRALSKILKNVIEMWRGEIETHGL